MPEISRFMGIVIRMYIDEHNPPHFHADHGEDKAEIEIEGPRLHNGSLPPHLLRKVLEWARIHHDELLADWYLLRAEKPILKIKPYEE